MPTQSADLDLPSTAAPHHARTAEWAARVHQACDAATEALLYAMLVFSPWAFGATQDWSIRVMHIGGSLLGLLLFAKLTVRKAADWSPPAWGEGRRYWTSCAMAILTGFVLIYCLISAVNSRATFTEADRSFTYRTALRWLPHSYDQHASWEALWSCAALALSFWAARDWLLTKSNGEQPSGGVAAGITPTRLPRRLRRLLWVVSVNGGLLAFEGLLQRAAGTNRLLWMIEPWMNKTAEAQFGPYAYRSNAAQYFLLAWPTALGFWSVLQKGAFARRRSSHNYLLPCILIMGIAPLFCLSRAGALIGSAAILAAAWLLLRGKKRARSKALLGTAGILGLGLVLGISMDWHRLSGRFAEASIDSNRWEIWQTTWRVICDFPLFGTGPGTFGSVYHLYRPSVDDAWHAYAHNDWLEFLMTFGSAGFACILALLALILISPRTPTQIPVPAQFCRFVYLAVGAGLAFAAVDFPFQIYSIAFLFVILGSVLASVSRPTHSN